MSITQLASGLHSFLWNQSQGALLKHFAEFCTPVECLGQGCSGAQGRGGPAAGHRRQCSAIPRGVSLRMHTEQSLAKGFVPQEPYPTKSSPVTCSSSHINAHTHTRALNCSLAHGCAQLLCHLPSVSFFCPFYESHI